MMENEKNIEKLSKKYSVSRDVILRKLLDMGKISKEAYEKKHSDYQEEMYRKPINSGGGNYYNTKKAYSHSDTMPPSAFSPRL